MNVKVFDGGYMPRRAHFDDAGIDLLTPEGFTLRPGESRVVDLKVGFEIPIGYFGKLESKSGLNVNHGVICPGGVIDSGFRGLVKVRMMNTGSEDYTFMRGDKVVQMVLIPVLLADLNEVDELTPSESGRDNSGYGSIGR
jgi:dUTP pyrophosphatase